MATSKSNGKRESIKKIALRLFSELGVDAVSIRDLANECEMSGAGIYAHFRSRDVLIAELFYEGYAAYGTALAEAASGAAPFRVKLERLVRTVCALHDGDPERFRFLLLSQHSNLRNAPRDLTSPVEVVARAVAAAMEAGEIPARDPALATSWILGLIVQPATVLLYGRLRGTLSNLADEIVGACWRALS